MLNSLELTDKKEQLKKRASEIIDKAEKEVRKLNEGEDNEFRSIITEIKDIEKQIKDIESKNIRKQNNLNFKEMEKFSLLKAINDVANNRQMDERALEVVDEGMAEMRKAGQSYSGQIVLPIEERAGVIQATSASHGQEAVAEDKLNILEPLRAKLALVLAGASYMSGLVGNVSIPTYSGSQVGWAGEVNAATDGTGTFGEVNLEPKRLTAYIDVSKQFLIQDSVSAEEMLKRDIVAAIANKLEATILGAEAGDTTKPAGLFNGVMADEAPVTYGDIVTMEATLESANVRGDIKYLVSPTAKAQLKVTKLDNGSGRFLMEGNEMNGYPVLCTSAVAGKGVLMGNFQDLVIGQWGGING